MKRILMITVCMILLSACQSYKELDRMQIVAGLYLDTTSESELRLTAETVSFEGGKEQPRIYEAQGKGVRECLTRMMMQCPNELYLSHMEVIAISEEFAKNHLTQLIEHILRDNSIRFATPIIVSKDADASQLISTDEKKEIMSYNLSNLLENSENTGRSVHREGYVTIRQLLDVGNTSVLPVVEKINDTLTASGCAVVGDNKILFLDEEETMFLNILSNDFTKGSLGIENDGRPFSVSIKKCDTSVTADTSQIGRVQYKAVAKFTMETAKQELKTEEINAINTHIRNGVYELYSKLTSNNLDALGVMRRLKAVHPEAFRHLIGDKFSDSELIFETKMSIGEAIT